MNPIFDFIMSNGSAQRRIGLCLAWFAAVVMLAVALTNCSTPQQPYCADNNGDVNCINLP
jgi:hypothetical protein